jgi:hypothetical protein
MVRSWMPRRIGWRFRGFRLSAVALRVRVGEASAGVILRRLVGMGCIDEQETDGGDDRGS